MTSPQFTLLNEFKDSGREKFRFLNMKTVANVFIVFMFLSTTPPIMLILWSITKINHHKSKQYYIRQLYNLC